MDSSESAPYWGLKLKSAIRTLFFLMTKTREAAWTPPYSSRKYKSGEIQEAIFETQIQLNPTGASQ
jgi:hypothetical protein